MFQEKNKKKCNFCNNLILIMCIHKYTLVFFFFDFTGIKYHKNAKSTKQPHNNHYRPQCSRAIERRGLTL